MASKRRVDSYKVKELLESGRLIKVDARCQSCFAYIPTEGVKLGSPTLYCPRCKSIQPAWWDGYFAQTTNVFHA